MTRLSVYEDGVNNPATEILEDSARAVYYAAMQMIRFYRHNGDDVPYMSCSDKKINFLLTCKRMSVNFGFDE